MKKKAFRKKVYRFFRNFGVSKAASKYAAKEMTKNTPKGKRKLALWALEYYRVF